MKSTFKFFEISLLMWGVFGADKGQVKSVMEGGSVTLNPDLTQIKNALEILWKFNGNLTIAKIDENGISFSEDKRFRDRLQLNQTGSLTIKNMRINHSGSYKLRIEHDTGFSDQEFTVIVSESPSVTGIGEAEIKIVSVMEGDPVTLHVPEIHGDELIVWRFGDEGKLIAKADIEAKSSPLHNTDERFRDRLQLDHQTGSLIITNTKTTDSGLYTVKISSNKQTLYKRFTVTVSVVPEPPMSPGAAAGIVLLVAAAAAAAGVIFLYRHFTKPSTQTMSVHPTNDVILKPDTEIQTGDEIQWLFGVEDTLIAEMKKETREMTTHAGPDMIFMDKLKLDKTTGSLTIKSINNEHAGLYTLKIRRGRKTLNKRFQVSVYDDPNTLSVTEGDSVILKSNLTDIKKDDEVQVTYGTQEDPIAEIREGFGETFDGHDGKFSGRLKLDMSTGNLTITDTKFAHSGLYILHISRKNTTTKKKFLVYIYERTKRVTAQPGKKISETLETGTKIQDDDLVLWMFGDEDCCIAQMMGKAEKIFDGPNAKFKGNLLLNKDTGNLTIPDIKIEHMGVYKVMIVSGKTTLKSKFRLVMTGELDPKTVSVTAGEALPLPSDLCIQRCERVCWSFEGKEIANAKNRHAGKISYSDDERFKGRLELNHETGSLTIKDTRTSDNGTYKLQILSNTISGNNIKRSYKVTVLDDEDPYVNVNEKETGRRVNESATVVMPLLNGEDLADDEEGMSSL